MILNIKAIEVREVYFLNINFLREFLFSHFPHSFLKKLCLPFQSMPIKFEKSITFLNNKMHTLDVKMHNYNMKYVCTVK